MLLEEIIHRPKIYFTPWQLVLTNGLLLIYKAVMNDLLNINKPLRACLTRKWYPKTTCCSAYQHPGSPASPHVSVHEDDLESGESRVNYSAAPIISIIASIVVVFVMSLITGVGV